jgi:uncharacterized membrane protein
MKLPLTLLQPKLRHVMAALCAAGALHLCVTLAAPELSDSPAYRRLAARLEPHKMQVLPPVTPANQELAFMGPEQRYAACLFLTRNGSVAMKATLPGPGWVVSIHAPSGENFYSAVAQPGRPLEVSVKLVPADDRFAGLGAQVRESTLGENATLAVPADAGIIIVRAPDQGSAYRARNLAVLRQASCAYTADR